MVDASLSGWVGALQSEQAVWWHGTLAHARPAIRQCTTPGSWYVPCMAKNSCHRPQPTLSGRRQGTAANRSRMSSGMDTFSRSTSLARSAGGVVAGGVVGRRVAQ